MQTPAVDTYERHLWWPLAVARSAYRQISRLLLNPNEVVLRQITNRGSKLLVFQNEDIGRRLILLKQFEDAELDFCLASIAEGDLCIDVGGNIGYFAIPLARTAGTSGHILCIEPLHRNALVIALAATLNNLSNLNVVEAAAVDISGIVTMHVPDSDSAYAHLAERDADESANRVDVSGVTIDSLLVGIKRSVAFLKVDVEGAEEVALRGAVELLHDSQRRPRMIMAELVPAYLARFGSTMQSVLGFLAEAGYAPYRLQNKQLTPFKQSDWGQTCNVFFTPISIV